MAIVRDYQGDLLTEAEIRQGDDSGALALAAVGEPGALLQYFFGRGQREVEVHAAWGRLFGRLETRWRGRDRLWLVRMAPTPLERVSLDRPEPEGVAVAVGEAVAVS
jgi:hypothetical protein